MVDFSIDCRWESALHEPPEVGETSALLKIVLGNQAATRNEDSWSRTVRDEVRVSAYPLALWFAASWWRLRWEPLPPVSTPSHSWRMTHELAAAGYGYAWPRMLFVSDGESIQAWAVPSKSETTAAVRYLTSAASHSIPSLVFERAIDEFIGNVLSRLEAVGIHNTTLHDVWREIAEGRGDAETAAYRRLEAMLGFDPDDCPEHLHVQFSDLIPRAGAQAVAEIAPVCASSNPGGKLREIIDFAESGGLEGQVDITIQNEAKGATPWERGRSLARQARELAGLNGGPLNDEGLCGLLGLSTHEAFDPAVARAPLGICVRPQDNKRSKFILSKRHPYGKQFELARLLGDHFIADRHDHWLPATHTKTARQKTQRAFAAEFLCPIHALKEYLADDFSIDAIEEASEHFRVSAEAVKTQLVNNDLLPRTVLGEEGVFDFPYRASSPQRPAVANISL
jgi:hypothetical protein